MELIVAITIALLLVAVMLSVTQSTLKLWHRAQSVFTSDIEAKLVLDAVERDLHAAIFRDNGSAWLAVDVIAAPETLTNHGWRTSGTIKPSTSESLRLDPPPVGGRPPSVADTRFGLSGAWLRFITTNIETKGSGNPGGSQPIAVSYQIGRRPLSGSVAAGNPATVRYTLFRSAVANDTTLLVGLDVLGTGYASSSSTFPAARAARSLTNPNSADAIGSNVIDLSVWLFARNASGELQLIFPVTNADFTHTASSLGDFPEVADVMMRVLTEDGAKMIDALESGAGVVIRPAGSTDAEWWWSVAEANSRVHVRRIYLKGGRW